MAYVRGPQWKDLPAVSTPITAARLNAIEDGLVTASQAAEAAATPPSTYSNAVTFNGAVAINGPISGVSAGEVGALPATARGLPNGVASLDGSARHAAAELYPGVPIQVRYYAVAGVSAWRDAAGNVLTARPTARTDIPIFARAPAGTAAPTWLVDWDEYRTF